MIGKRFLQEPGSSNTAERALTYGALFGEGARALSGGMGTAEMASTALGVPMGLTAGRLIGAGLRRPWLANQLINRSLNPYAPSGSMTYPLAAFTGTAGLVNQPNSRNESVNALAAPNQ
jgi:hypothetical protein